jgi:hypothetical protein
MENNSAVALHDNVGIDKEDDVGIRRPHPGVSRPCRPPAFGQDQRDNTLGTADRRCPIRGAIIHHKDMIHPEPRLQKAV